MLVWGGAGDGGQDWGDGARYNPSTDQWTPITTNGAPQGRVEHYAVWTGSKMIVWGGGILTGTANVNSSLNTGGRYDPSTDQWLGLQTDGAPPATVTAAPVWPCVDFIISLLGRKYT